MWSENEKMSCHALVFFDKPYEPKMDVILTISFKIAAEVEMKKTYVLRPTSQTSCNGFV